MCYWCHPYKKIPEVCEGTHYIKCIGSKVRTLLTAATPLLGSRLPYYIGQGHERGYWARTVGSQTWTMVRAHDDEQVEWYHLLDWLEISIHKNGLELGPRMRSLFSLPYLLIPPVDFSLCFR